MGLKLKIILISLGWIFLIPRVGIACHKGGSMGLAKGRPGALSADFTYSFTFTSASTSGTSGCKNWDFVKFRQEAQKQYIAQKWEYLSEEAARGSGAHLQALAQLIGCAPQSSSQFNQFLQKHHASLFASSVSQKKPQAFLKNLKKLLAKQQTLVSTCQILPPKRQPS